MRSKYEGFPQEDDIVYCKVTKIYPNSVFVELLEYENKMGMIHISEVSPGRIRNLRDFVSEGRQIVCKVLRIDQSKGHIDLSLRRVNSHQRREKLEQVKQEQKAEQILKNIATKLNQPFDKIYAQVSKAVMKEYEHLFMCFVDVAAGDANLEKLGVPKKLADELTEAVTEKFKPKKIEIEGEIVLQSYHSNGVEKIKKTLTAIEAISPTISLSYLGAGRFKLHIEDFEYKPAEKNLKKAQAVLEKFNDKVSTATFTRAKSD